MAQSAQRLAKVWTVRSSKTGADKQTNITAPFQSGLGPTQASVKLIPDILRE